MLDFSRRVPCCFTKVVRRYIFSMVLCRTRLFYARRGVFSTLKPRIRAYPKKASNNFVRIVVIASE